MKKEIQEVTKIVSKTAADGEVNFEPMDSDMASKINGTEITDSKGNRVKIKDTGRTLTEEQEIERNDLANIAKEITATLQAALRDHGDTIAYVKTMLNPGQQYVAVYVNYEQDPDNPGKPSTDKFIFTVKDGKIYLEDQVICGLDKQSGTLVFNRDLAKNSIFNFLDKSENDLEEGKTLEGDYPNGQGFENPDMESQDSYKTDNNTLSEELLLGFRKAVQNYKKNPKNRESVKELLRQAREFEGDTIESKLRNAIQLYKSSEQVPVAVSSIETVEEPEECEDTCECPDICMNLSLFIRLLEYVREEMEGDDEVLHRLAENVSNICKEKGQASMDDYESILNGISVVNIDKIEQ